MNTNPNLLTNTRYYSGKDWVNLDQSNLGLNYGYVSSFAVISLQQCEEVTT